MWPRRAKGRAGRRRFHAVFETFDGATVTVSLEKRGEEETWARFDASWDAAAVVETEAPEEETEAAAEDDAEAAEEESPDVEAEIAELVSRTSEWAFLIPGFKAEQLGMRMARLIELPEAEGDDEEAEGDGTRSGKRHAADYPTRLTRRIGDRGTARSRRLRGLLVTDLHKA